MATPRWVKDRKTTQRRYDKYPARWVLGAGQWVSDTQWAQKLSYAPPNYSIKD